MTDVVSTAISVISLTISGVTLWFTLLRRGRLRMTKPTLVFFGYDFEPRVAPKIFLRTLLYSTSARGKVIEGMHVNVLHSASAETFSFWGYGETNKLVPGSGLYLGQTGIGANHHFVLSPHRPPFTFTAGDYTIEVFASLVGRRPRFKLSEIKLCLSAEHADALSRQLGVLFESDPDTGEYVGHIK